MQIRHFFDPRTSSLAYVVHRDGVGAVVDPVLDFDPKSGRTWTESADAVARYIDAQSLQIPYVLDTHAHADHFSAMPYFAKRYGAATFPLSKFGGSR
jgi:glyoxylase-like metal-dependent hydrolase (beta-lactamase superfamily II)